MRVLKLLFWTITLVLITVISTVLYYVSSPLTPPALPQDFSLQPGSSLTAVAQQLKSTGVIQNTELFVLVGRALGLAGQIKAGNYQLTHSVSVYQLLEIISKGRVVQSDFTLIEGWTFKQLREALNSSSNLRHDTISLTNEEILKRIGASENHPEGLFFPDTYIFSSGSSDIALLKRAYQTMQRRVQDTWQGRDNNLPLQTPYQALILASIVEKETGQARDRRMIASVFINRLNKGMRLQTDPTVIYGIGDKYDGNIRKRDLLKDSQYNTYTRYGLTPTPIAMPGLASLQAVMHPENSSALYFVARGDGSSQFSSNLPDHNRAVRRYQLKIK
jgi:UPF0755 protein